MFRAAARPRNGFTAALELCELIYHCAVRQARGPSSNALAGLAMNVLQVVIMILALYLTMTLLGISRTALRGDFVVFLMSGVLSYSTYQKTMSAVFRADGPTSPMMLHAPMNTAVAIAASALGALYLQVLVSIVVMFGYHVAFKSIEVADPSFAFSMLMLSWVLGLGTGMVLLAIRPWAPRLAPILMTILTRVNFFASGKMMVGNALSFSLLHLFDWNPLFHIIDQMRGAIFVNCIPRNSSVTFALWWSFALIVIGLMGEFYSRRNISASWAKR